MRVGGEEIINKVTKKVFFLKMFKNLKFEMVKELPIPVAKNNV